MAWVRIHDGALRNFKVMALSDAAFRLWVAGLAHCQEHLTDGEIRREHLKMLTARVTKKALKELTTPIPGRSPLWHETESGYQIHDYLVWNEPREVVLKKRAEKEARMKRWRERRDALRSASGDASQNASGDASQNAPGDAATTTTTTTTPQKNKKKEPARESARPVVARYVDRYRERCAGRDPVLTNKDTGSIALLVKRIGQESALALIDAAFRDPDPFWVKRGYSASMLTELANSLQAKAGARQWSASNESASGPCPICGNPERCKTTQACNERYLAKQRAQTSRPASVATA